MATTILQWNANSLRARSIDFKHFISNHKPDIICIQETYLKPNLNYDLPGYSIERKDRLDQRKGGVATMIRNGLIYKVINLNLNTEALVVSVKLKNRQLTIVNIYEPPDSNINIDDYKELFSRPNSIMVGDLNAYSQLWGATKTDNRGTLLDGLIEDLNLSVLNNGQGTHIKPDGSLSPIDLSITSTNLSIKCSWKVNPDSLGSDHRPIIIGIDEPAVCENGAQIKYCFKKADWDRFKNYCKEHLNDSLVNENLDKFYENIINAILSAADASIPKSRCGFRSKKVPYWNEQCDQAVRARKEAERKMIKTKNLDDCIKYRETKARAQKTLKQSKRDYWESYCNSLTNDTKLSSVWKMAKKMSGTNSKSEISTLNENNKTMADTSSNKNYSNEFQYRKIAKEIKWKPNSKMPNNNNEINEKFTILELQNAIRQCKKNSSPGQDNITYEMLKRMPKSCLNIFLEYFNRVWEAGQISVNWKEAVVIPILKPGTDATRPQSYRPISLTPVLCKIMERIVTNRLVWFLEKNSLLNEAQSGYRKYRSTLDQLTRLHDSIYKSINNKGYTVGVFIDFSRAYDMLWKDGLLCKLRNIGIGGNIYNWINDFLTDRTIRVKVGNEISDRYILENGTPQGSVISPILFLMMINDIPSARDTNTEMSLYADDSGVWRSGGNLGLIFKELQDHINAINRWCKNGVLKLMRIKLL